MPTNEEIKAAIEQLWQERKLAASRGAVASPPTTLNGFMQFLRQGGGTVADGIDVTVPHNKVLEFMIVPQNAGLQGLIRGACPKIKVRKIIKISVDLQGFYWTDGKLKLQLSGVPEFLEPELEL